MRASIAFSNASSAWPATPQIPHIVRLSREATEISNQKSPGSAGILPAISHMRRVGGRDARAPRLSFEQQHIAGDCHEEDDADERVGRKERGVQPRQVVDLDDAVLINQ